MKDNKIETLEDLYDRAYNNALKDADEALGVEVSENLEEEMVGEEKEIAIKVFGKEATVTPEFLKERRFGWNSKLRQAKKSINNLKK